MAKHIRAAILLMLFIASAGSLSACIGAGISGVTYLYKSADRPELTAKAAAGDPQAQYHLGLSYCCMGAGFSTQTATEWLCKSAAQNHAQAQYELGRIYAGEVSRTPSLGQKVRASISAKEDPVVALAWFRMAAHNNDQNAVSRLTDLKAALSPEQWRQADEIVQAKGAGSCLYDSIFPETHANR